MKATYGKYLEQHNKSQSNDGKSICRIKTPIDTRKNNLHRTNRKILRKSVIKHFLKANTVNDEISAIMCLCAWDAHQQSTGNIW